MSQFFSVLRPFAICGALTLLAACGGGDGGSSSPATGAASSGTTASASASGGSTGSDSTEALPPVDETPPEGPATGAAQLSWLAPDLNADGTALSKLTGYRIRYGKAAGALDKTIEIASPAVLHYTVENLTPGTWYFEVVAVNEADIEGPASNTGSKTIS